MRQVPLLLLAVMGLVLSCTGSTGSGETRRQIVIAGEFPLVRSGGAGATDASRAVALALANHPTVGGYRLVYEPLDDSLAGNQNLDKALQNAKLMVREPRILGAVGPWNSFNARAVVPITGQANLVMVSPSTTLDCLTARPRACLTGASTASNYFRIAAPDSVGARSEADVAVRSLRLTNFAVITDTDPANYGMTISDAFAAEVVANGGRVVSRQKYSQTDQSYAPLLRRARDAGAEAVFVGGFSRNGACRIRAAMTGVFPAKTYFFSGDGIVDVDCLTDAGDAANDHLVGAVSARQPASVPASLRNLPRSGSDDAYVFAAYDCAEILVAAIDRAIKLNRGKIPTREQVVAAVAGTHDFKGLTGTFSFNANGDAANPAVSLYYVRNGTWTFWQNA
ncbi:MAG TPA: branched-chain amino acid ABC transporter substrate-binding protein [Candidatus Dormibacteraeota bacterium]|nr:branched-chain amino acid ABC transporter substrate-binding protein [Candidatus Dormibacteraeota bacterium]